MSYQVIARKYRPQRFSDVVGQDHVTTTLANAIRQGRIAHAYLFCGPRGTGKTTIARVFAKCLNCTGGPSLDFADDDPRCLEIAEGRSLDVLEIDGASNRGIDEIRALRDTVKYAPAASKFKIYIIDEVHMLTKEAFNALLKTLEEPPGHVKFMFATTEPEKVLPTILSRCQRFDLRRIPAALMVRYLAEIARLEKVQIDAPALLAIARGADGGMRDAESTLDQLISFCGERIQESDVLGMFGLAAQAQVSGLFRSILDASPQAALRQIDELCRNGKDLGRLLADLLGHGRNLLVQLASGGESTLDDLPEAERESLKEEAAGVTLSVLTRVLDVLAETERRMRDASSRRIVFEVALLKAIEARQAVELDELLARLQQLRGSSPPASESAHGAGRPRSAASPIPEPIGSPQIAAAFPSPAPPGKSRVQPPASDDLRGAWQALLVRLNSGHRFLHSYLTVAQPVRYERGTFTIGFGPEAADQLELVNTAKNLGIVKTLLAEEGYAVTEVVFVKLEGSEQDQAGAAAKASSSLAAPAESAAPPSPAPPTEAVAPEPKPKSKPLTREDFKNDPLIRKALDLFKGQIVEVRN